MFYPTVAKRCATCNNGGDPSSILTCTGLTGYTFSEGPPSSCKDYRGADVGSAIDRASCVGTSNGNTYVADDSLMDATSKESCEGVATNHTYSPAVPNLCKDNLNQDAEMRIPRFCVKVAIMEGSLLQLILGSVLH